MRVNFDGVQNAAEIWLNGRPVNVTEPAWGRANYHESGWTPWQADLTPHVRFGGQNLLALRVTKNTQSAVLDKGDYYFLGGIHRPVTLFSVPETHVADVTVRTFLLDDGKAEVKTAIAISGSDRGKSAVSVRLEGEDAIEAAADAQGRVEVSQIVSNPKLWSAEFPNLYSLDVELKDRLAR